MSTVRFCTLAAAALLLNACASKEMAAAPEPLPQQSKVMIRSFDQGVVAAVPGSWPKDPASVERGGNSIRATFVPAGFTPATAGEKITVVIREADGAADEFAYYSDQPAEKPCKADRASREIIQTDDSGEVTLSLCGKLDVEGDAGSIAVKKTVEKYDEIYEITHTWYGAGFDENNFASAELPVEREVFNKHKRNIADAGMVCTRANPESYCSVHADLFSPKGSNKEQKVAAK